MKLKRTDYGYTFTLAGDTYMVTNEGRWNRALEGTRRHWQVTLGKEVFACGRTLRETRVAIDSMADTLKEIESVVDRLDEL